MQLTENIGETSLFIKDVFMIVGFLTGLIGIYIKHQIDFAKFKTEINLRVTMHTEKLKTLESIISKQTTIQQELLLDSRESKTMLNNVVHILNELKSKINK